MSAIDSVERNEQFVRAAERGEYDVVKRLLGEGADLDARCIPLGIFNNGRYEIIGTGPATDCIRYRYLGSTPPVELFGSRGCFQRTALQAAADEGNLDVVRLLIQSGSNVNAPAAGCIMTALQAAAGLGNSEMIQLLLDGKADVNAPEGGGMTALQAAAMGGHRNAVQLFLNAGANVNAPAALFHGRTALQAAAEGGHQQVVQLLLDSNADVNAPAAYDNGRTALQAAAEGGHQQVVQLLLDCNADVNAGVAWERGRTALQAAAGGGYEKVVQLLLDSHADVNEPAADDRGRTALQAAAGGGYEKVVQLLLDSHADVNAPAADFAGRTALQAAAGGGYERVVQLLLDSHADINAPAVGGMARTALQAASEGGHEKVVQLLLDSHAVVNAPAAYDRGMTALQAAAGGGYEKVVQLLLDSNADVNAPAAGFGGSTALQAASEGGHEKVVQLLLDSNADVNAPAAYLAGRTALQAASEEGHERVVRLLLGSQAEISDSVAVDRQVALKMATQRGHESIVLLLLDLNVDINTSTVGQRGDTPLRAASHANHLRIVELLLKAGATVGATVDSDGQNVLHRACREGNFGLLSALLAKSASSELDSRDISGSTPLHIAVREKGVRAVQLLTKGGVNKEIRDTSGNTPLKVALQKGFNEIFDILLKGGASTDLVDHDTLPSVLRACDQEPGSNVVLLLGKQGGARCITGLDSDTAPPSPMSSWDSIQRSKFVNPSTFLECPPGWDHDTGRPGIHWAWSALPRLAEGQSYPLRYGHKFNPGIPNSQEILSLTAAEVVLVGYVRFDCLTQHLETASGVFNSVEILPFLPQPYSVEISWIMRQRKQGKEESGRSLRSIHFRGTLRIKNLIIPQHGAEFVTLFLKDINRRWIGLIGDAKVHLDKIRDYQLTAGGKKAEIIDCLLKDSKEWYRLRKNWLQHVANARDLLRAFKEHDVLYTELIHSDGGPPGNQELDAEKIESLGPIKGLSTEVNFLANDCGLALSELDKETKELIELEFNLVSIYEARRSIEMTTSMKRLSWITFIFLPLMFVTGLFGMNINLLAENPAWQWYFIIAVPFLLLVLGVWIFCKYLPVTAHVEQHIGKHLEVIFKKPLPAPRDVTTRLLKKPLATARDITAGLRRRRVKTDEDLEDGSGSQNSD